MEVRRREEARGKTGQPDLTANVSIFMAATVRYLSRPHPRPLPPPRPVDVYSELFYMAEGRWKSLRKMNDSLTSSALLRVYPVLQARRGIYDSASGKWREISLPDFDFDSHSPPLVALQ